MRMLVTVNVALAAGVTKAGFSTRAAGGVPLTAAASATGARSHSNPVGSPASDQRKRRF